MRRDVLDDDKRFHARYAVKLLEFEELKPKKGINYTRDHVRRLGNQGKFPKPIHLGGGRRIAFVESEIDAYLAAQIAARDAE